jgi:hypothetical protein
MASDKNKGVVNTGNGDVVVTNSVIGATPGQTTTTNSGVINTGNGNVVITGSVVGSGNQR